VVVGRRVEVGHHFGEPAAWVDELAQVNQLLVCILASRLASRRLCLLLLLLVGGQRQADHQGPAKKVNSSHVGHPLSLSCARSLGLSTCFVWWTGTC